MGKYFRNSIISISKLQDDSASSLVRSGECKRTLFTSLQSNIHTKLDRIASHTLNFPRKNLYTGVIKERALYFQLIRSMQILVPCDVRFVKNLQIAEAWNFNKLVKNV